MQCVDFKLIKMDVIWVTSLKKLNTSNFADMLKISMRASVFTILLITGLQLSAQPQHKAPETQVIKQKKRPVKVLDSSSIYMEKEIAQYLQMMDSLDRLTLKTNGYRIQIFSASGPNARQDALLKQSEFLKLYSHNSAYTRWSYPNWVVRLGDFRTRLEAQEFHHEIREMFPASFIVKDEIKVN